MKAPEGDAPEGMSTFGYHPLMPSRSASSPEPQRLLLAAFHDRLLLQVRSLPAGGDLIELGCGSGTLTVRLADTRSDIQITGIDSSTDRLRRGTQVVAELGLAGRIRFERADLATLPLSDQGASIIVAAGALGAVSNPHALFSELHRVMCHGGTAILVDDIPEAGQRPRKGTMVPPLSRPTQDEDSLRAALKRSPFKDHATVTRHPYESGTFLELLLKRPVPPEPERTKWRLS